LSCCCRYCGNASVHHKADIFNYVISDLDIDRQAVAAARSPQLPTSVRIGMSPTFFGNIK
jgi:hypothetical protein